MDKPKTRDVVNDLRYVDDTPSKSKLAIPSTQWVAKRHHRAAGWRKTQLNSFRKSIQRSAPSESRRNDTPPRSAKKLTKKSKERTTNNPTICRQGRGCTIKHRRVRNTDTATAPTASRKIVAGRTRRSLIHGNGHRHLLRSDAIPARRLGCFLPLLLVLIQEVAQGRLQPCRVPVPLHQPRPITPATPANDVAVRNGLCFMCALRETPAAPGPRHRSRYEMARMGTRTAGHATRWSCSNLRRLRVQRTRSRGSVLRTLTDLVVPIPLFRNTPLSHRGRRPTRSP